MEAAPVLTNTGSGGVEMKEAAATGRTLQVILVNSTVKHVLGVISRLNLSYHFEMQQKTDYGRSEYLVRVVH